MADEKDKGPSSLGGSLNVGGAKPASEGAQAPPAEAPKPGEPGSANEPDRSPESQEVHVKKDVSYGTVSNITTGRPGENPAPPPGDEAKDAGPDVNYDAGRPVRPGEVKTGMVENKPAGALGKDDISEEMKATMPEYAGQKAESRQRDRRAERDRDRQENDRLPKRDR